MPAYSAMDDINVNTSPQSHNQQIPVHLVMSVPLNIVPYLNNPKTPPRFQHMQTEQPIMTIGPYVLLGRFEHVHGGTDMIFDPRRSKASGYVGAGRRRLFFAHK